jgi:hypothetical protein
VASEKLTRGLRSGVRFAAKFIRAAVEPPSSTKSSSSAEDADERSGQYLFAGDGRWIAYRSDRAIFDSETNDLLGYLPYDDGHIADANGDYLCSIVDVHLWRAYGGAPWGNAGVSPVFGPGIPPLPISNLLDPVAAPAGYGPFSR